MPATFTIEDESEERVLVVRGDWSDQARRIVERGDVDALRLNYALGYRERDLGFLGAWPLQRLEILARTIKDLTPVYRLAGSLEHLKVTTNERATIDLTALPRLSSIGAHWQQVADTLPYAVGLKSVFLLGYSEPDFCGLHRLQELTSLRLKEMRGLRSLDGVEELPQLTDLQPVGATQLADIEALARCRALQTLWLEASLRLVPRLDSLRPLRDLQVLEIGDCGDFESLRPLEDLARLEALFAWGTTCVTDGDLSVLSRLPQLASLRMMNRKHYRPSVRALGIAP